MVVPQLWPRFQTCLFSVFSSFFLYIHTAAYQPGREMYISSADPFSPLLFFILQLFHRITMLLHQTVRKNGFNHVSRKAIKAAFVSN